MVTQYQVVNPEIIYTEATLNRLRNCFYTFIGIEVSTAIKEKKNMNLGGSKMGAAWKSLEGGNRNEVAAFDLFLKV